MSGGHFDYAQFHVENIADSIKGLILSNDDQSRSEYGETPETIAKFKEAEHWLRRAAEMVQRIDWLVSDDDGEDTFHERWKGKVRHEAIRHQ